MTDRPVLVTGVSGFIAKHCAVELLNAGYIVRGTLRSLAKAEAVRAILAQHADVTRLTFVAADLTRDEGWAAAAAGTWGVLHVASPFPLAMPKDENELIVPAVNGTLRVLRAAVAAGVERFVQTSSVAAVMYGHDHARHAPFTEADWTRIDGPGVSAYARSKTLAERAARDFVAAGGGALHYASVNPGFVLGPLLDREAGSSADAIARFLKGQYPGCPQMHFPVVDVRDVALMHRLALESGANGGRYLAVSGSAWFLDMMRPIKARLGERARKVPSRNLPNWVIRAIALFDPAARAVLPELGLERQVDNSATRRALPMTFRPVEESAPAMAESLLRFGLA